MEINTPDININVKCCLVLTVEYIVTVYGVAASVLRLGLENNLRVEREQRQSLQKALQREQDNSVELRTQMQQLQGLHEVSQEVWTQYGNIPNAAFVWRIYCHLVEKELRHLKTEKQQLQQKCELQEQTLQEMGLHLSQSVLLSLLFINSCLVLVFIVLSFLLKVQTKDGGL